MNRNNRSLVDPVYTFIEQHRLILPGQTVILGLSGGPDSLFLLHLLAPLHTAGTITLIAAHLDHQWRSNSANDVQFCRKATERLGVIMVEAKMADLELSVKFNGSQEELGRKARRTFLEMVAHHHNADRIALAHHHDDQQETFFIRMIRGASLTGLTGMKPQHGLYIRPLLHTRKIDIIRFLVENGIAYLTDPSNSSSDYLRNRIRQAVIPSLRDCDNRFDTTFNHTLTQLQEVEEYLQKQTAQIFESTLNPHNHGTRTVNLTIFFTIDPYMQQRLLIHWLCLEQVPFTPSAAFFQEMIRFLQRPEGGTHTLHPTWSLVKKQGNAFIQKK